MAQHLGDAAGDGEVVVRVAQAFENRDQAGGGAEQA